MRNEVEMWATAGYSANPFGPPVRAQRILPGAIGRIKPDLTVQQAQAKLDSFVANLRNEFPKEYPAEAGWNVRLLPARETLVGSVQKTLLRAAGSGRVSAADWLREYREPVARPFVRTSKRDGHSPCDGRRPPPSDRATSHRESAALLYRWLIALLIVVALKNLLLGLVPADIPRLNEVGVNAGVLAFVFLISTLTGLLFGLIPALQASRPDLVVNLKEGTQGAGSGARHHRFRGALVVVEFALSLMLMIAAGLLLRSFGRCWRSIPVLIPATFCWRAFGFPFRTILNSIRIDRPPSEPLS